jgi:hypothetical protein
MKIDYLKTNSRFKNLDKVLVDFDENHFSSFAISILEPHKLEESLVPVFRV